MDDLQKEHSECIAQLEKLKKLIVKVGLDDELVNVISDSINRMQIYVDRAKEYVEESERLASEVVELNNSIYYGNAKIAELKRLFSEYENYSETGSINIGEVIETNKAKKGILEEISKLLNDGNDDIQNNNRTNSYEELRVRLDILVEEIDFAKERLNEVLKEMSDNKTKVLDELEVELYE